MEHIFCSRFEPAYSTRSGRIHSGDGTQRSVQESRRRSTTRPNTRFLPLSCSWAFGNKSTTPLSIPSNSRELETRLGATASICQQRSGSMPQAPSACTPRLADTVAPMPTATLPSSLAPGSAPSSSSISSRSSNGSRMKRRTIHRWNGASSAHWPKSTTASTRTRLRNG